MEVRSAHDKRCLGLNGEVGGVGTAEAVEYALLWCFKRACGQRIAARVCIVSKAVY